MCKICNQIAIGGALAGVSEAFALAKKAGVDAARVRQALLGGFAAFALILASLGIYAVISYSVEQRSAEFGIRIALGASVRELQTRILLQTLSLAGVGMAMGAGCAWLLSRALGSLLFGVTTSDPVTFVGMMGALTVVACLAGYLPALRVSKIEPMAALRSS